MSDWAAIWPPYARMGAPEWQIPVKMSRSIETRVSRSMKSWSPVPPVMRAILRTPGIHLMRATESADASRAFASIVWA